jgi:uncharacterized DUF497 family protein
VKIMIFAWDDITCEHLAKHAVSVAEAQEVVAGARRPFPCEIGDDKLVVWGQTSGGRYLQVIFVLKKAQEVPYESLSMEDWLDVEAGRVTELVRVIHAMEMTEDMKKQYRKRRR